MRGRSADAETLAAALLSVRDELRSGRSLRQAILAAGPAGSPFGPLVGELGSGGAIADTLERRARIESSGEASFAIAALAAQARTGGNPIPLVDDLIRRVRERARTVREMRALTSQARLQARAVQWLTPGFLGLLVVLDPAGMARSLAGPHGAAAVGAGLLLQTAGAWWIGRIVGAPFAQPRSEGLLDGLARVPVVRACAAPCHRARRRRRQAARRDEVAQAAELIAVSLAAGLPPVRALEMAARSLAGTVGDALRDASRAARAGAGLAEALREAMSGFGVDEAGALARALGAGHGLGVPVASTLQALAAEIRHTLAADTAEQMHTASLKVLLPLALLILPAFVLACLVPLFLNGLRGLPL